MDEERMRMTETILSLTMEILTLLLGEEYSIVKKKSEDDVTHGDQSHPSEEWKKSQTRESSPENDKKILEVINKIIMVLTGEVPVRCQDVAVYFSMEEWDYIQGHKDLSEDLMVDAPHPVTVPAEDQHNSDDIEEILVTSDVEDDITCNSSEDNHIAPYLGSPDPSTLGGVNPDLVLPDAHATVAEMFPCGEYGEGFPEEADVLPSKRLGTVKELHTCPECGKCFSFKSALIRHKKIHKGEKPFSCPECGKQFPRKSDLSRHYRIHNREKPFSCSECGKRFSQKCDLIRHERIHTGEKLYSCPECGKRCSQKSDLIRHKRIHTGEKQYSCSECGKCFSQKCQLIYHVRVHTGEKPYECSECGKCFSKTSDLAKHKRVHQRKQSD